jgi:hypothetical protein
MVSAGSLAREKLCGYTANVLRLSLKLRPFQPRRREHDATLR